MLGRCGCGLLFLCALVASDACLAAAKPLNFLQADADAWRPRLRAVRPIKGDTPDRFFQMIPEYRMSATASTPSLSFESRCFAKVTVELRLSVGAAAAEIKIASGKHQPGAGLTCNEGYLFAWFGGADLVWFTAAHSSHTVRFEGNYSEAQMFDLKTLGVRVFQFRHGVVTTLEELVDTLTLFLGEITGQHLPQFSVEANVKFLANHMNYSMPERPVQRVDIPIEHVHAGDLVLITRLDGMDPIGMWAMGARAGHLAVVLEYKPGQMYVCESNTAKSYWPHDGIWCTPWAEWIDHEEAADYLVSLVPLKPSARAVFDNAAAVRMIDEKLMGLPYGFHNVLTGWIDTDEDNYPPIMDSHTAMLLVQFLDWLMTDVLHAGSAGDLFAGTMNKRLGTEGLNTAEVMMEGARRGLTFQMMAKMPEQDSWTFKNDNGKDGPSMVCCVLVAYVYRAGGLFGNYSDEIQCSEFSLKDVYLLDFFDKEYQRPDVCVKADPDLPFCQILGKYRMSLDTWSTIKPFPHMMERCPGKEPLYLHPDDC